MELDAWRRLNDLSIGQLAERLGVTGCNPTRTVQRYLKAERIPGRAMIRRIGEITNGEVTDADFPVRDDAAARANLGHTPSATQEAA